VGAAVAVVPETSVPVPDVFVHRHLRRSFSAALPGQVRQQLDIHIARRVRHPAHRGADGAKAFHGLGYIAATDRLFQMELFRRAMRGTLAERKNGTMYPAPSPGAASR
jgi:acyl-homoserine lactone acylase PvdQ